MVPLQGSGMIPEDVAVTEPVSLEKSASELTFRPGNWREFRRSDWRHAGMSSTEYADRRTFYQTIFNDVQLDAHFPR